ncbi:hypothetical protein AGRA3207_007424 [Actinomadura graeca]|uniref:Uncharacterized protein n=1 Tax=Actinomadura graeca TaxID=2750812 RepID=A0ABX8R481_9ACTN|nr:hypothetical protein [Actinomadura graeca]QXJ25860.1 hypothetical protein AGRA3207_007424 [Actinomadura graeca]
MDRDHQPGNDHSLLEQFLRQAFISTLKTLDAAIDVDQRLRDLYREVGLALPRGQDNGHE